MECMHCNWPAVFMLTWVLTSQCRLGPKPGLRPLPDALCLLLPTQQAMALQHGPCVIEVATNLVDLDWTTYSSSSRAQTSGTAHSLAAAAAESSSTACHAPAADAEATDNRSAAAAAAASGGPNSRQCKGAGPEQVLAAIAVAAELHGLPPPGAGYVTNKLPRELLESARQQLLVA